MGEIERLNVAYEAIKENMAALNRYSQQISNIINRPFDTNAKCKQSLVLLESFIDSAKGSVPEEIKDIYAAGKLYYTAVDTTDDMKNAIICKDKRGILAADSSFNRYKRLFLESAQNYQDKYQVRLKNGDQILNEIVKSIRAGNNVYLRKAEVVKKAAKDAMRNQPSMELLETEQIQPATELPEQLLIARHPSGQMELPILNDIGIHDAFQNIYVDLKKRGNILIRTDYENLGANSLDEFVLAYILRCIEEFPLGALNVHIFAQNPNFLYKRLANSFQSINSGEGTRRTIQLHTDVSDLKYFRDVICEDIFRKTSIEKPDLYAVYETDHTDPFNLIVLRDGLLDGSGYVPSDILETIASLTETDNTGHKCGLRFLMFDDSKSFEKNMSAASKHQLQQIRQNCGIFEFSGNKFFDDGQAIEVLHVHGSLDKFVQNKAQSLAKGMDSRTKDVVRISDVADAKEIGMPGSILTIPVGKAGENIVELPLSCKDDNGTVAGQCIGYMAIGQSGSGKSSFFHSLVINGCLKYSPKDLQFWLLDFKNGGASSKYSNSGLPHIRMIAENNKVDDALCLFQMVLEEMERRSKAFNDNFADNIVDYNRIAKQKNLEYFPRIIIAIDEVQEIFRDDNAATLQKLISSISTRMRSAGMHFVMVAQNLCEGKSYMLKDSFLPSATGRICFRVAPDVPRDSGFDEEFIGRKAEIAELKTGEAYVGYGKNTVQKVKLAFASPQEMSSEYFPEIRRRYSAFSGMKPLIIGSKQRLSAVSKIQGTNRIYRDVLSENNRRKGVYTAVIGEDAYRMTPLELRFSQLENSSALFLGSDKLISSSLCTSVALALARQDVPIHLFNGDRTRIRDGEESVPHAFMYFCRNAENIGTNIHNHKLSELGDALGEIYTEYLKRQDLVQKAEDDAPEFPPLFLIANDLFAIECFMRDAMVESNNDNGNTENSGDVSDWNINYDIFGNDNPSTSGNTEGFNMSVQEILGILTKTGWQYNIHAILAIKGDPYSWRNSPTASELKNVVLFNSTEYADQMGNSYYLKEMLKNISNEGEQETMAVWVHNKSFSKIRPVIYQLSNENEKQALDQLIRGID